MPLRPIPRNPNGWDDKLGTRFRRLDTPRVHQAAAKRGLTISELVRDVVLREVDRLGIPKTVPLTVEQQHITLATSVPLKAVDAQVKSRGNIDTFRQYGSLEHQDSVSRETFASEGMGMKDTPPRF